MMNPGINGRDPPLYLQAQLTNMKNFLIVCISLLFSGMIAQAKAQGQAPAQGKGQPQTLTPAQEAALMAQMQAQAKKMTIPQLKVELEKSPNPVLYTKQILKKRFKIDTIVVTKTRGFNSLADSLSYTGKERKVYGPYGEKGSQFLVQVLTKAPNEFYHVSQIFIDTSVFRYRIADSLGDKILERIRNGSASFEQLAQTYSMGGEAATKGDLGWIARGVLLPQIEHEIVQRKKGEVFKTWSPSGLHIIRKTDDPRQDTGFALLMRIFL
jgi:parvulin-like peptidyl-prolyl isomerase